MNKIIGVLMLIVLTGCAHSYSKPGYTKEDFSKVQSQCLVASSEAGLLRSKYHKTFMDGCLAKEGWSRD